MQCRAEQGWRLILAALFMTAMTGPVVGCQGARSVRESCGNGAIDHDRGEVCDDGNQVSGDGCSADCRSDERCGNGYVDVDAGEHCDATNLD